MIFMFGESHNLGSKYMYDRDLGIVQNLLICT